MDLLFLGFFVGGRGRGVVGCAACRTLFPWPGSEVLTTGPPGNSFESSFILSGYYIIVSTFGYYGNTAMNICVQVFGGGMFSILLGIVIDIYTYMYIYLELLGDLINL